MIFRTSNPAIRRLQNNAGAVESSNQATYKGIAIKSVYYITLTFVTAVLSFLMSAVMIDAGNYGLLTGLLIFGLIVTLVSGITATLNPNATKVAGSIYAVAQGFTMGFTALMFSALGYAGEVFAALFATIVTFAVMLGLYSSGVVRVSSGFKKFMLTALISAIIVNLLMFIMSLFSQQLSNLFYGNGLLSIGISLVMILLAALMILFDLNRMTEIVTNGLDKKYEWFASFGLLVTLIWLYTEFLRLFLKIASRRR